MVSWLYNLLLLQEISGSKTNVAGYKILPWKYSAAWRMCSRSYKVPRSLGWLGQQFLQTPLL